MKFKIGIVGLGFVGTAVKKGFEDKVTVETLDSDRRKPTTCKSLYELTKKCDVIFICVPTPMNEDGSADMSIVERVVHGLDAVAEDLIEVVIKSTVLPGTTERLQKECPHIRLVFNPEFLTERNHIEDFKNQDRVLLGIPEGGDVEMHAYSTRKVYEEVFPTVQIVVSPSSEVEMSKYVVNTFLAMKVSYANEIHRLCRKTGIDYATVASLAQLDKRLGNTHWTVPGPDGKLGWGGTCFPKDTNGLIEFGWSHNEILSILMLILQRNESDRGNSN